MPTRTHHAEGDDRVGSDHPFCILGVTLTTREDPEHDIILESFMTGRYDAFDDLHPETVRVYLHSSRAGLPYTCYYSSLWNLAKVGISKGVDPHDVCGVIRTIVDRGETDIDTIRSYLIPASCLNNTTQENRRHKCQCEKIHPAVNSYVLKALAEEGILESDAKRAVSRLIYDGTIRASAFADGSPLFHYGDERRRIVSRVLNCVHAMHDEM